MQLRLVGQEAERPVAGGRIGERLLRSGLISEQQLQQALEVQSYTGAFFGQIVVDLGFADSASVGQVLGPEFGVEWIDLLQVHPDPAAVQLVTEDLVRSTQSIPIRRVGDRLEVAMLDPLDVGAVDALHAHTNLRIVPYLTMATELMICVNDFFDASTQTDEALDQLQAALAGDAQAKKGEDVSGAAGAPIVRLVNTIIQSGLAARASDIHFEPNERGLRVRFRVDGRMLEQTEVPRAQQTSLTARLKVLCLMDITENRRCQDGRMTFDNHGRAFDIRASSVPTVYGEKIVLRVLDKAAVLVPLSKLGFSAQTQHRFEGLIHQPHGMILVVGPTGSGKSTTLYASLNMLNDSTRNIMTLEDPVEYNVLGLNQVQVNARIGLTFASGLRSFVRQDPDVILIGEIRDGETAEMAVQASLTGHLVLSTLHANSAVGAVSRLENLGVNRFLIAQALSGVISQRLVARVCTHCAEPYHPSPELLKAVQIVPSEAAGIDFRAGAGCRSCHDRGYLGRLGLYELMLVDEDLRKMMMVGRPDTELRDHAIAQGMVPLRESAMTAIRAGLTTPQEMGRVVLTHGD